jgi:hypothetical protein
LCKFPNPWYIQKLNFIRKRIFPSLSTHLAYRPSRGPSSFLFHRPFPPSPLGLCLSTGPSRPLGPADRAPVAACRIATSHTGRRLKPRPPLSSPRPADRWAPPIIPHLRLRLPPLPAPPSSTPRDAPRAVTRPPSLPPLIPPLTSPLFNGVKVINAAVTHPLPSASPPRRSPGPHKRAMRPPALTAPHPLSPELLRALATSSSCCCSCLRCIASLSLLRRR